MLPPPLGLGLGFCKIEVGISFIMKTKHKFMLGSVLCKFDLFNLTRV